MQKGVRIGTVRGHYAVEPTDKQRMVVDGYLKGLRWTKALRAAGYNESSALHYSKKEFLKSKGIQRYISQMDKEAQKRFGESLPDKVMGVYLDGLEATKPVKLGQRLVESPDWMTRKQFLDRFAEFFGWVQAKKKSQNAVT